MQLINHHKKTREAAKKQGEQRCSNIKFTYYYGLIIIN
jgi:hypothetical protein